MQTPLFFRRLALRGSVCGTRLLLPFLCGVFSHYTMAETSCTSARESCHSKTLDAGAPETTRLMGVKGLNEKTNDVVFCGKGSPQMNVIFFGGDVQDFSENMLAHRDNKHYEKWNLEHTAQILWRRFPESHVWVVKPSSMHLKTFSAYINFVESDTMGCPTHSSGQRSWEHLTSLVSNSIALLSQSLREMAPMATTDVPVSLVGFSKGCVVLNQLLYDLEDAKHQGGLYSKVEHMFWLDGGHNGGSNTWITNDDILKQLASSNIHVHSDVTPYQMQDQNRKWIGKEQKKFVEKLKRNGAKMTNTVHFSEEERSLNNHFRLLTTF